MVRNIIYAVILAAIVVPSWQIASIKLEKQSVTYMLEEHANNIKKPNNPYEMIIYSLKKELGLMGLPTEFTLEVLEEGRKKVRISYQYNGAASVFGYTYYQTDATLSAETKY